jgi:hypothetical protein
MGSNREVTIGYLIAGRGESEGSPMQVGNRHVLTIQEQPLILKALNALSRDIESKGGEAYRTLKRLAEFEKEGCGRLILNLREVEEPLGGSPANIRNVGASLVGGVLVVTCQVTTREIGEIKVLTRRHFFPTHLMSKFDSLFSHGVPGIETAVSRIASFTRRAKANLHRIRPR